MKHIRMPNTFCPHCNAKQDSATSITADDHDDKDTPSPTAVSVFICFCCGAPAESVGGRPRTIIPFSTIELWAREDPKSFMAFAVSMLTVRRRVTGIVRDNIMSAYNPAEEL